jgi:CRP-like cAMP-binding protein
MGQMAQRLQEFQGQIRTLSTERVERRLARVLLRLVCQVGRKIEDGVLIDLSVTRQDLAEMSGTTLYTVSRILSQWERQGLVDSGRERVVIRNPHGLVMVAEDVPTGSTDPISAE